jgi:hypothetical protein
MMSPYRWAKTTISTPDGPQEAIAPVIVSASRAADLPAFHVDWFFQRLHEGCCVWKNPFNQKTQYVSFGKTRAIVFWSKNPAPMMTRLDELDRYGFTYYFQFTLNDYTGEQLETGVPPLRDRVDTFRRLSDRLGRERVIWRFDPVLLAERLTLESLLERIADIGEQLRGHTDKLVFSFIDIESYAKVRNRLLRHPAKPRELTPDEMTTFAEQLAKMSATWGIRLATCSEAIDLDALGIEHNRCVDPDLLIRLAGPRSELAAFLSQSKHGVDLFGNPLLDYLQLKDKGQRKFCGCIVSKDVGPYDTCRHDCDYCYATSKRKTAQNDMI